MSQVFGASPLEPDEATLRRWIDAARDLVLDEVRRFSDAPAADTEEWEALLPEVTGPLPEEPSDPVEVLRCVVERWAQKSFLTPGPGYLAYIPGGGLLTAPIADFVAGAMNRYVGVFAAAPLLARLEVTAVDWLRAFLGLSEGFRGVLTTGGSMANLIALACAREERLGDRLGDGVVYTSSEAHHSIERAARLVGFRRDQIRVLPSDENCRLDPEAVLSAVRADRLAGRKPAVLVASAGTTNSGAVDDLGALGALARSEGLWFHVDAAYGGFFRATRRGARVLAGMDEADSVTVDPHKGLFLPYGTGLVLVRGLDRLRAPFRSETSYLPPLADDPFAQDFCETSPELSRDFRGLRVYLSLRAFGARAFRAALDEKLDLAALAARRVEQWPFARLVHPPDLSLFAFGFDDAAIPDADARERANRQWLEAILRHRRVWLSGTRMRQGFVLRVCVLSFRTHRDRVEEALELAEHEGRRILRGA